MKTNPRNPRGAGRKPIYKKRMSQVTVALTDEQLRKAEKVGKQGGRGAGIRKMVDEHEEK